MKAIVDRKELLDIIGKVKVVIPHRSTLPIIEGILFQVRGDRESKAGVKLWLTATNLEQALTGRLSDRNKVMGTGGIVVKPKELENFLKAVSTDKVTLATVKNNLKVDADNAQTTLEGNDVKDYPPVPKVKGKEVKIVALAERLGQVSYAMATEESRPVLNAVYFEPENDKVMNLTAADGFRLATVQATVNGKTPAILIPFEAVKLIERFGKNMVDVKAILQGGKQTTSMGTQTTLLPMASFQLNGVALITQGVTGTFPSYKQLIPTTGTPLTVKTEEFKQALKIPMATMDKDCAPIMRLQSTGKELKIWHFNPSNLQTTAVKIPAVGKIKIAFNPKYLKDMVDHIATDTFTIKTVSLSSPGLVISGKAKYVIMPMFVDWCMKKETIPPESPQVQPAGPAPSPEPEKQPEAATV